MEDCNNYIEDNNDGTIDCDIYGCVPVDDCNVDCAEYDESDKQ